MRVVHSLRINRAAWPNLNEVSSAVTRATQLSSVRRAARKVTSFGYQTANAPEDHFGTP
jgi:hypothetical protein